MPWKETCVLDERTKFIARLLDGEKMSHLCEEYGISRKTGYKVWNRYQNEGHHALVDRARIPHRFAHQLPEQIERTILRLKKDKPHFGAPKLRELIIRKFPNLRPPAVSTVHAVLDRHGLVKHRRRRHKAHGTALSHGREPNELWCTPTSRVSSCSGIAGIVIHSPSPIGRAAICSRWRPWRASKTGVSSRYLSGCLPSTGYRGRSARTTGCLLPAPTGCFS